MTIDEISSLHACKTAGANAVRTRLSEDADARVSCINKTSGLAAEFSETDLVTEAAPS